jgi:predicted nuclease with TOPRIM domain
MAKFGGRRARQGKAASSGSAAGSRTVEGKEPPATGKARVDSTSSGPAGTAATAHAAAAQESAVDYAKVGEHVGTVLEAAKAAAEKMRLEATNDARQIRADAQLQARVGVEESQKKVERADAEATRLYAEAKQRSDDVREEADAYATSTREAAEAEAVVILADATQQASDEVDAAQKRQRTLDRNIAATENRLRQLVGGVRELASGLEELVPSASLPQQAPISEVTDLTQAAAERRAALRLPEPVGDDRNGN